MDRPGTCIILDKKYNIANSSCHFGSYGSIWTGPSPKKYYMDLRSSFGPYTIFLVTDRSISCHMTLSAMNYLLCIFNFVIYAWRYLFIVSKVQYIYNFGMLWFRTGRRRYGAHLLFSVKPAVCCCEYLNS
jgi:hypothetical protein